MDILTQLSEKIDNLLKKYEELKKENESLRLEVENYKNRLEEREFELIRCKENITLKELELEEVLAKIESILKK